MIDRERCWVPGRAPTVTRFAIVLEHGEDEGFAHVPALPGCASSSSDERDAVENVKDAIRLTLAYMRDNHIPVPEATDRVIEVGVEVGT